MRGEAARDRSRRWRGDGGAGTLDGPMNAWWIVVFFAVFLIGVTKSGFGAGVGLMIVPMTAIAMGHLPPRGSEAALGLLLPLLILGDFIALWQYRGFFQFHRAAAGRDAERFLAGAQTDDDPAISDPAATDAAATNVPTTDGRPGALLFVLKLLPGTAVGVVIGGLLLWWFHHTSIVGALIRIEIGIESILLVGLHWWRQSRGVQQHLLPEPWRSHLTGGFAAVSSTLAHAAGPIIAMYLLPLKLDRRLFVGTCAIYFFLLNSAKLPAYWAAGQFQHAELSFTLKFIPLVIAGALFGFWVNRRMSDKVFTKLVYMVTFALGWYILYDGVRMVLSR